MALESEGLKGKVVPVLVFANKMDVAGAMTPMECMTLLDLQSIQTKPWHIT
jgi:signal recognition particle receptor subunit beta